jgi:hypothetical protein
MGIADYDEISNIVRPPSAWLSLLCGAVLMLLALLLAVNNGTLGWKVRLAVGLTAFVGSVFFIHLWVELLYIQ